MGGGGAEKEERGVGLGVSEQAPFLPGRTKREAQWAPAHLQLSEEMGFGGHRCSPSTIQSPNSSSLCSSPFTFRVGLYFVLISSAARYLPVCSPSPTGLLCLVFSFPLSSHPSPSSSILPSSPTLSLLSIFPCLFPAPFPHSASVVRRPRSLGSSPQALQTRWDPQSPPTGDAEALWGLCPGERASKPAPLHARRRVAQKGLRRTQSPRAQSPPAHPSRRPHSLSGLRPPP